MKAAALLAAMLLAACQRAPDAPSPSPEAPASSPAAAAAAAPEAFDPAQIVGTWQPYSRGAEAEFGLLDITDSRITFANFGSAAYQMRGRYAVLDWREARAEAGDLCGAAPPGLIEFRLQDKAEILAAGTPGTWLEVSFYASAETIGTDRETSTQLCRIATWSR